MEDDLNPSLGDEVIVFDRTAVDPNRPDEDTFPIANSPPGKVIKPS